MALNIALRRLERKYWINNKDSSLSGRRGHSGRGATLWPAGVWWQKYSHKMAETAGKVNAQDDNIIR